MLKYSAKKLKGRSRGKRAKERGRKLTGVVVSDKMKKTVVVAVSYEKSIQNIRNISGLQNA